MRIKRSFLVLAFLMVLYIGPMIFISSYGHTAIPAQPNIVKDFSTASDDWYEYSWHYRKSVSINGSAGAGIDYAIMINFTYDSDMQNDFDDIRFTAADGVTLLDCWRETYVASTSAVFWVKISANLNTDQQIYMYYGDAEASTISNGTAVFLFFDDFENNNLDKWTIKEDCWSTTDAQSKYGTYSAYGDAAAVNRTLEKNYGSGISSDFLVHTWTRLAFDTSTEYTIHGSESNDDAVYMATTVASDIGTYNGSDWNYYAEDVIDISTWYRYEVAVDFTDGELQFWLDRVAKTTHPLKDGVSSSVVDVQRFSSVTSSSNGFDHWLDDFYIRKWLNTEPVIDSFGAEETNLGWDLVGTAILKFSVGLDMWGLDTALIILGLVMIPVSTIYLAYGIKHDRSSDRLFYGLIIFFLGFGLLIGGILP